MPKYLVFNPFRTLLCVKVLIIFGGSLSYTIFGNHKLFILPLLFIWQGRLILDSGVVKGPKRASGERAGGGFKLY